MSVESQGSRSLPAARESVASDVTNERDPLDWYIEVCAVCGCQLGPGIGSRTRTGRCVYASHRGVGGTVVRVQARPDGEQDGATQRYLPRIRSWSS